MKTLAYYRKEKGSEDVTLLPSIKFNKDEKLRKVTFHDKKNLSKICEINYDKDENNMIEIRKFFDHIAVSKYRNVQQRGDHYVIEFPLEVTLFSKYKEIKICYIPSEKHLNVIFYDQESKTVKVYKNSFKKKEKEVEKKWGDEEE